MKILFAVNSLEESYKFERGFLRANAKELTDDYNCKISRTEIVMQKKDCDIMYVMKKVNHISRGEKYDIILYSDKIEDFLVDMMIKTITNHAIKVSFN